MADPSSSQQVAGALSSAPTAPDAHTRSISSSTSGTSFEAYRPETVLEGFPRRVEALCWWQDTLLVGLLDGNLLFMKEVLQEGDSVASRWQTLRAHRGMDRKPILQLAAVSSRPLLLKLTEEGVHLHTLPDMKLKCLALRSRFASCFAWDERSSRLAVAVKKKVLLYQLVGMDFVDQAEHNAPELVLCMEWVSDTLFIGTKKAYSMMSATGTWTEVGLTGSAPHPVITCVVSGEVMLVRDTASLFYSAEGRYSRKGHLTWSEPVNAIVCAKHYAVALLAGGVEVRSLRRVAEKHVVQKIACPSGPRVVAHEAAPDGGVFLGFGTDTGGVWRMAPVSVQEQAHTLAALGEFQEALALAALMEEDEQSLAQEQQQAYDSPASSPGAVAANARATSAAAAAAASGSADSSRRGLTHSSSGGDGSSSGAVGRRKLEDRLRLVYGHHLFSIGEYDEGMAQFALCSHATALVLVRLFPSLVPLRYRQYLPEAVDGAPLPPVTEPSGAEYSKAVTLLLPYLLSHRTRLITSATEAGSAMVDSNGYSIGNGGNGVSGGAAAGSGSTETAQAAVPLKVMLTIIDTAILKAMVAMPDTGALLRFVQQPNNVDVAEGERVLTYAGQYAELAALYKLNGKHEEGLQLLYKLSQAPETLPIPARGAAADLPGLPGVWAAVRYLVSMTEAEASLIRKHSKWILLADPEAGLQAFLQMQPPLQPSMVLSILKEHSPEYAGMYLEAALSMGLALPQDYHSELLLIYLQDILYQDDEADEGPASAAAHPSQLSHTPNSSHSAVHLASSPPADSSLPPSATASPLPGSPATDRHSSISRHRRHPSVADRMLLPVQPPLQPPQLFPPKPSLPAVAVAAAAGRSYSRKGRSQDRPAADRMTLDAGGVRGREGQGGAEAPGTPTAASLAASLSRRVQSAPASRDGTPALSPHTSLDDAAALAIADEASPSTGSGGSASKASSAARPPALSSSVNRPSTASSSPQVPAPGGRGEGGGSATTSHAEQSSSSSSTAEGQRRREEGAAASGSNRFRSPAEPGAAASLGVGKSPKMAAGGRLPPVSGQGTPQGRSDDQEQSNTDEAESTAPADSDGGSSAKSATSAAHKLTAAFRSVFPHAGAKAAKAKQATGKAGRDVGMASSDITGLTGPDAVTTSAVVAARSKVATADATAPPGVLKAPTLYQRLRDLVYTSPYIDPQYVLTKLPQGRLLEIQALMLERLGDHHKALRLYAHGLHDLALAEAYCDRVHDAAAAAAASRRGSQAEAASAVEMPSASAAASTAASVSGHATVQGLQTQPKQQQQEQQQRLPGTAASSVVAGAHSAVNTTSSAPAARPQLPGGIPVRSLPTSPGDIYMELIRAVFDADAARSYAQLQYHGNVSDCPPYSGAGAPSSIIAASSRAIAPALPSRATGVHGLAANHDSGLSGPTAAALGIQTSASAASTAASKHASAAAQTPPPPPVPVAPAAAKLADSDVTSPEAQAMWWRRLSRVLSRKRDRIDAAAVLRLVPAEVAVADVLPLLEGVLCFALESRRNLSIVKALRKAENIRVREENVRCKQERVLLSLERACCICHKRIGSSVFVAYPNHTLAHYLCFKRQSPEADLGGVLPSMQAMVHAQLPGGGLQALQAAA